jgi:ABC-type glutathione transport system ATPase component
MAQDILVVNNLSLTANDVVFFKDVSFTLKSGRTLAIIGETGCGKSLLCKSLVGLQITLQQLKLQRQQKGL